MTEAATAAGAAAAAVAAAVAAENIMDKVGRDVVSVQMQGLKWLMIS